MSKIRMVHLSDIHFGQERDGSLPEHNDVREALIRDCSKMQTDIGSAHCVVVTGDIAFSGQKKEFDTAGLWLDDIVKAVKCPKIAVHTIPGNHDVDVKAIDYAAQLMHEKLRACSAEDVDGILEKICPDGNETSPLLTKLAAYNEFASRYNSPFQSAAKPISIKEVCFPTGHRLRFIGFASVQVSDLKDEPNKLVLGSRQYIFSPDENVEYIVMSHHPLHWFKDRLYAQPRLVSRARVWLFGHEHQTAIQKISENQAEYMVIHAGATNPPASEALRSHTYNWVEFELVETDQTYKLKVTVHPRIWISGDAEFGPDRNRIGGELHKSFEIACPHYKANPDKKPVTEQALVTPFAVIEGEEISMSEDESFAKLLYYFWRYLDWRQRYAVLAKVDAWPYGLDKPIPQVIERNALQAARSQKKLRAVWEQVMQHVPEADREQNPFQ